MNPIFITTKNPAATTAITIRTGITRDELFAGGAILGGIMNYQKIIAVYASWMSSAPPRLTSFYDTRTRGPAMRGRKDDTPSSSFRRVGGTSSPSYLSDPWRPVRRATTSA